MSFSKPSPGGLDLLINDIDSLDMAGDTAFSPPPTMRHSYDPEDSLLGLSSSSDTDEADKHALRTAPIITSDALAHLGTEVIPQRAVYGRLLSQHARGLPSQCRADRKGKGGAGKVCWSVCCCSFARSKHQGVGRIGLRGICYYLLLLNL